MRCRTCGTQDCAKEHQAGRTPLTHCHLCQHPRNERETFHLIEGKLLCARCRPRDEAPHTCPTCGRRFRWGHFDHGTQRLYCTRTCAEKS